MYNTSNRKQTVLITRIIQKLLEYFFGIGWYSSACSSPRRQTSALYPCWYVGVYENIISVLRHFIVLYVLRLRCHNKQHAALLHSTFEVTRRKAKTVVCGCARDSLHQPSPPVRAGCVPHYILAAYISAILTKYGPRWRGTVVERRSLTGELSLSCARPTADGWPLMWVNRPLQVSELGQLSLSSFLGR